MLNAWHWLSAHWLVVSGVLAALITILNSATSLWHDHPKAVRWLSFIVSALSVVRSKGAEPGALGALKLPLIPEFRASKPAPAVVPPPSPTDDTGPMSTTALIPFLVTVGSAGLLALSGSGCTATASGGHAFDPASALSAACAVEPAINVLAVAGVCDNLKEPAKTTCKKVAALIHAVAPALLVGAGAIYDVCQGRAPKELPRLMESTRALTPPAPASVPASVPAVKK